MATFREIDEAILALVDDEGEILDVEAFEQLQMERTAKAENMALWALDLADEQDAIKKEIGRLKALQARAERKEKSLKEFLAVVLGGEKLKTARITVSYRKAAAVEITDEDEVRKWAMISPQGEDILKYKEPEISKTELKRLISEGHTVPGAAVVERVSVQIK